MEGMIKIKLVRSRSGTPEKHKRIVKGLGLRKSTRSWCGPTVRCFEAWSRRPASSGSSGIRDGGASLRLAMRASAPALYWRLGARSMGSTVIEEI